LGAIVSTPHLAMKFPSPSSDVITGHVNQKTIRKCYAASLKKEPKNLRREEEKSQEQTRERAAEREHVVAVTDLDPRVDDVRVELREEV